MANGSSSHLPVRAGPAPHPGGRHSLPDPPVSCHTTGWVREVSSRAGFGAAAPGAQRTIRRRNERRGRLAEFLAAAALVLKGYRIVARRVRTPYGELDLVAVRGRRLAFIEVKYRDTLAAAALSVGRRQARRMAVAAEHWAWAHPAYRGHRFGLDAIDVAPWCLPRHRIDALQPL